MREIKFNKQGIEAILNGSKTMTRRPLTDLEMLDYNSWLEPEYFSKYKVGETVELAEVYENNPNNEWRLTGREVKIINIKVERLQDISEEDCIKEGGEVACLSCDDLAIDCKCIESEHDNHKDIFRYDIWNFTPYKSPYDWNSNPYVFIYEFEVV